MKKTIIGIIGFFLLLSMFSAFAQAASTCNADVNQDYKVNILDLILIRNNIGTNNLNYDINNDGKINILDLVEVRNQLNQRCGKILKVPQEYPSIQSAINAAQAGDEVRVSPGIYYENVVMKDGVDLIGSGADVTIIDGRGVGNAVYAKDITDNTTTIKGFTITSKGHPWSGISLRNADIIIMNNIIRDNGGCDPPDPLGGLRLCGGNGISSMDNSSPFIINNVVTNNEQAFGISIWYSKSTRAKIINNIIINNAGGIDVYKSLQPIISNNNIWNDDYPLPSPEGISADPLFVNPDNNNYHLQPDSPCINAGINVGLPYYGSAPDMGAFEYIP